MADTTNTNNYKSAVAQFENVVEGQQIRGQIDKAAGQGSRGLEAIANTTQALLSEAGYPDSQYQNYAEGIVDLLKQKDSRVLVDTFNQLYRIKYGESQSELNELFSDSEAANTIGSSNDKKYLQSLAFNFYDPDYEGEHGNTHSKHKEVLLRQDILRVINGENPRYFDYLDERKINEIINEAYKKDRPTNDNPVAEDVAKQLDNLLQIPLNKYRAESERITKEFIEEELPNSSAYLADMIDSEDLKDHFLQFQQQKLQEKQQKQQGSK